MFLHNAVYTLAFYAAMHASALSLATDGHLA